MLIQFFPYTASVLINHDLNPCLCVCIITEVQMTSHSAPRILRLQQCKIAPILLQLLYSNGMQLRMLDCTRCKTTIPARRLVESSWLPKRLQKRRSTGFCTAKYSRSSINSRKTSRSASNPRRSSRRYDPKYNNMIKMGNFLVD